MSPLPSDVLGLLAGAIIPADERDDGAAAVNAGPRLAERMTGGPHARLYAEGLETTEALAQDLFGRPMGELMAAELADLVNRVRESAPAFFKQLRLDVCALYLSDPDVWRRIGFPGPSIETGGYPDFDQPQDD
jgi:hypothetical protein